MIGSFFFYLQDIEYIEKLIEQNINQKKDLTFLLFLLKSTNYLNNLLYV